MKKVIDEENNVIGWFDGSTIFDLKSKILYRILGSEIFSPMEYEDSNFQISYKGLLGYIGKIRGNIGLLNDHENIFTILGNTK